MSRCLYAGRQRVRAGRAGTGDAAPALLQHAGLDKTSSSPARATTRGVGPASLDAPAGRIRGERGGCCRTSLTAVAHVVEHVPVLASEVAELLDPQPGDTVVDCTFGAGGHAAVLEPQLRGARPLHRHRPRPRGRAAFKRFAAGAASDTRFIHGNFALVLRNLAATGLRGRRDRARPGHLVDADRPARARLQLCQPTRRWTCAWTRPPSSRPPRS